MTDYQIQNSTRRCADSGRELRAGERYFSVLIDEGAKFIRQDFSAEAWKGPPPRTFSFWQGRLPANGLPRRPPIDEELLADCFVRLEDEAEPAKLAFRYVLALLLLRKKRMRLEDSTREGGQEVMLLRDPQTKARYRVIDPNMPDNELEGVQDEVFRVLGWE